MTLVIQETNYFTKSHINEAQQKILQVTKEFFYNKLKEKKQPHSIRVQGFTEYEYVKARYLSINLYSPEQWVGFTV